MAAPIVEKRFRLYAVVFMALGLAMTMVLWSGAGRVAFAMFAGAVACSAWSLRQERSRETVLLLVVSTGLLVLHMIDMMRWWL